jgi:hypothetical protein
VVTFRPAAGASVTMTGELRTNGQSHFELDDMTIGGVYLTGGSSDITTRNVDLTTMFIRVASNISLYGGSVGGSCDGTSETIGGGSATARSTNILIDGVRFHDVTRSCNPTSHVECLFVQEASYVTIRNSSFTNCDVMDMFFHAIAGGADPDHVVLQNNTFATTGSGGYHTIVFRADSGETLNDYLVQGNTFGQSIYVEDAPGSTVQAFRVCGNVNDQVALLTSTSGFSTSC